MEDNRRLRGNAHDSERAGSMVGQGRRGRPAPIYSQPIWHRCVELGQLKLPLVVILLFATEPVAGLKQIFLFGHDSRPRRFSAGPVKPHLPFANQVFLALPKLPRATIQVQRPHSRPCLRGSRRQMRRQSEGRTGTRPVSLSR